MIPVPIYSPERLWTAAHCFHAEGSPEAAAFVSHRLTMLLEGKVGYVIGGLRRLRDDHGLKGEKLKRLNAAITYYESMNTPGNLRMNPR